MASVLVTTRKIDRNKLGHHIADVSSMRSIPPANSLEGCVRSLSAAACVVCVNWTWEVGGPRSGSCVWLGWLVARGPGHFSSLLVRGRPLLCASSCIVNFRWPLYSEDEACAPPVGAVSVWKCPPDRTRGGCVSFPTMEA